MTIFQGLLAVLAFHTCKAVARHHYTHPSYDFKWTDITPTPELIYNDCGGGYQCARLELPLDWNSTEGSATWNEKFNMAIVRLPAQVPVTDERYGGPIYVNPGGPGFPGTFDAVAYLNSLQIILDAAFSNGSDTYVSPDSSARYFDIIGFDPRAVGNSTPWYNCMTNPIHFNNIMNDFNGIYLDWTQGQNQDFDNLWALSEAFPNSCIWDPVTNPGGSKIANFSGTTYTARDVVELAERHGEWREKQAQNSSAEVQQRLAYQPGEEMIQFYGESYGTVMGATLAAMQPHRVKRFLLDGVSDSKQDYLGLLNSDSKGGDPLIEKFFELCAYAGPSHCPFYAGPSPTDTRNRLQSILDSVKAEPIGVPGNGIHGPDIIRWGDIQLILSYMFEDPITSWRDVAHILAPLTNRNGSMAARSKQQSVQVDYRAMQHFDPLDPSTASAFHPDSSGQFFLLTWLWVIEGGETQNRYTKQEFVDQVWGPLHNLTYWFGDYDATIYQFLATWPYHNNWVFGQEHAVASNVTANPVLFSSNLVDAETSIQSARVMQSRFKGSGLIVLEGEGHCASAEPSLCHAKRLRYYFQTGKLPDDWQDRNCLPYQRPFGYKEGTEQLDLKSLTKEEKVLLRASIEYS